MSLTVNATEGTGIQPIAEGTYLAICNMLVDLGLQYNETYKNSSRKVLIGWEIPEETYEYDGEVHRKTLSKRYTASLSERATLRQDLASWRGRDFTQEELAAFDLRNIVGASCLINVIHKESNGKTYANISSIVALPKSMKKASLNEPPIVFDLDTDDLAIIDKLPSWIGDIIKKSETYLARTVEPVVVEELDDSEEQLPF